MQTSRPASAVSPVVDTWVRRALTAPALISLTARAQLAREASKDLYSAPVWDECRLYFPQGLTGAPYVAPVAHVMRVK